MGLLFFWRKHFFKVFYSKIQKGTFLGVTKFVLNIFLSFSFWKNRDTNVLLVSIFKNAWKKIINFQKWPEWRFWLLITFFSAFSKIPNKITIVCLLFLKLNQSRNTNFFVGVFLQKPKTHFFGCKNKIVLKLKSNLFFCVCSLL